MKYLSLLPLLALAGCSAAQDDWIQLFNGSDLSGWDVKISGHELNDNYRDIFRVEDGLLKVSYEDYEGTWGGEFGHIFYHQPFSEYILRVEYRFTGEQIAGGPGWALRNNGAMLHSQSARSMLLDQDFPVSVEAQFLGGTGEGERPTLNVCTPGTHVVMEGELITRHCTNSTSRTFPGDEWVTVEMHVHSSGFIYHVVEGDTVFTYEQPQIGGDVPEGFPLPEGTLLESGYIALQAETHPIEFRRIELKDLSRNR